jgi:hypothetical protein
LRREENDNRLRSVIVLYRIAVRVPIDIDRDLILYRLSKCGRGLDEMSHSSKNHPQGSIFGLIARMFSSRGNCSGNCMFVLDNKTRLCGKPPLYSNPTNNH